MTDSDNNSRRSVHDTPDSGLGNDPTNGPVNVPPKTSLPDGHPSRRPDIAPGPVESPTIDPLRPAAPGGPGGALGVPPADTTPSRSSI